MTNKAHFKNFSEAHYAKLPFSLRFDWWSKVVKDNWEVAVVLKNDQALAIWPYFIRQKGPWKIIAPAYFTPYAGPFISYPEGQKTTSRISYEHKMHQALIDQLPQVAAIEQQFHLNFDNGLVFRWNGFLEEINYTYILDLNLNEEALWSKLRENIRRQIRKAKKQVKIHQKRDDQLVEKLFQATFKNKDEKYPIGDSQILYRLLHYLEKNKSGSVLFAEADTQSHAVNVCVYDQNTAHYLIGGSASEHRNSAAASLLMWEQILKAKAAGCRYFNFEGSTIPSIERFLRGFGGNLHRLHRIHKSQSKSLSLVKKVKESIDLKLF